MRSSGRCSTASTPRPTRRARRSRPMRARCCLMPSSWASAAGVKLATVAPANPERGLPRIQGVYVLFDGATLAPAALIDGIALTSLRTAAVSALAVRRLAPPGRDAGCSCSAAGRRRWSHVHGAARAAAARARGRGRARPRSGSSSFVRALPARRAWTRAPPTAPAGRARRGGGPHLLLHDRARAAFRRRAGCARGDRRGGRLARARGARGRRAAGRPAQPSWSRRAPPRCARRAT